MSEAQPQELAPCSKEDVASFNQKLRTFVGSLSPGEQAVFQQIVRPPDFVSGDDVTGGDASGYMIRQREGQESPRTQPGELPLGTTGGGGALVGGAWNMTGGPIVQGVKDAWWAIKISF